MYISTGPHNMRDINYMNIAARKAKSSFCGRSRCGSIIVKDYNIIGQGHNSMPGNVCGTCFKDTLPSNFKSDKTCCIHAEQRAIMDALSKYPKDIIGSTLYFVRINNKGEILKAGKPYCTICSKMVLDVGIAEFVLWHEKGITVYDTKEYNDLSFQYVP